MSFLMKAQSIVRNVRGLSLRPLGAARYRAGLPLGVLVGVDLDFHDAAKLRYRQILKWTSTQFSSVQ